MTPYEQSFARWLGVDHAFAFWKGRVACYAILKAMGIGPGDEVIIPGFTCVMAVNPAVYLGAKPVFVDIEPVTYNLDPKRLAEKITPRTKIILAQHTYGYPADMEAMANLARERNIAVVEDCCLALGSRYRGKTVGAFGIAAYFSFQWNKPYTSGLGGMAVTSDPQLAGKIEELRQREMVPPSFKEKTMLAAQLSVYRTLIYPRTTALAQNLFRALGKTGLVVASSSGEEFTPHPPPGFFKGMSGVQQRSGARQFQRIQRIIEHRRHMREVYDNLLSERGWTVPSLPAELDPVLVRYPVRVADKQKALADAPRHFVELGSWFECPLHPIETDMSAYGYQPGMCPRAEQACREVVNLPLHPRANESTARRTVEFLSTIGPP